MLQNDALVYTDRSYTFTTILVVLLDATYLKMANRDKKLAGSRGDLPVAPVDAYTVEQEEFLAAGTPESCHRIRRR